MIYYTANLTDNSWWGLAGQLYGLALFGAAGSDFSLLYPPGSPGALTTEVDPLLRCLLDRFGKAGDQVRADIFHGNLGEVSRRVSQFYLGETTKSTGVRRVALTHTYEIPDALLTEYTEDLKEYDAIWVPSEGCRNRLTTLGVFAEVVHVPALPEEQQRDVNRTKETEVYCSVGPWNNLRDVVVWYVNTSFNNENRLLHLVCPDASEEELVGMLPSGSPPVSLDRNPVNRPLSAWTELFRHCQCYVIPEGCREYDVWARVAYREGVTLATRETRGENGTFFPAASDDVGQYMLKLLSVQEQVGRLAVVIPHKNRGVAELSACYNRISPQLAPGDLVVISDQGSDSECFNAVCKFCKDKGIILVRGEGVGGEWSLAKCRNSGARAAITHGAEYLFFLDCDVLVHTGLVKAIREVWSDSENTTVIPHVFRGEEAKELQDGTEGEIAPGISALSAERFSAVNGFDEQYVGWGSEDLDLLLRLDWHDGGHKTELKDYVCFHREHEPTRGKQKWAGINQRRFYRRLFGGGQGAEEKVNPDGWGEGEVIVG